MKTYGEVYSSIFEVLLKKIPKKKFIGEYANGEWKSIGDFLSFNKKNVAVHVIRDPRAMLSSWNMGPFFLLQPILAFGSEASFTLLGCLRQTTTT